MSLQSIFGSFRPDTTARADLIPQDIVLTNDFPRDEVARFADPAGGQAHGFYGKFPLPDTPFASPQIVLRCKANATTGNARMRFSYRAIAAGEAGDPSSWQEQVSQTTTVPGTAWNEFDITITLTAANLATNDELYFFLERLDDSGVDTLAAALIVAEAVFKYVDA